MPEGPKWRNTNGSAGGQPKSSSHRSVDSERVARSVARALGRRADVASTPTPQAEDPALAYLEELSQTTLGRQWLTHDPFVRSAPVTPRRDTNTGPGVLAPLPRRKLLETAVKGIGTPPMATKITGFDAGLLQTISRVFVWGFGLVWFVLGNFADVIRRRASLARRAERARRILERLGPTFVKLAQQLSIRADLLPYAYCEEFSRMLDRVKPLKIEQAIAAIERGTQKKITDVFAVFDPQAIGSGSLASVYQAILPDGTRVAVKVRRPRIGNVMAADMRMLAWVLNILAALGFMLKGAAKAIPREFSATLAEEFDFHLEARNTDLFRAECEKISPPYVTAPKVYFELCSAEVIVTEFVEGLALSELLGAVDRKDHDALARLAELGIDPVGVARNMLRIQNWSMMEAILFHGDPHPANMFVQPGNQIVMVDFGCCCRLSTKHQRLLRQQRRNQARGDVAAMAQTSIAAMGPLPPTDLDGMTKEIETVWWNWLYAFKSSRSQWWEKSSATSIFAVANITRNYGVMGDSDMLRTLRAGMMYDSIAYRLWPEMDASKEYMDFQKETATRAKKRLLKAVRKRRRQGLLRTDYLVLEEVVSMAGQALVKAQRTLDLPKRQFTAFVDKASLLTSRLLQGLVIVLAVVAVGLLWEAFHEYRTGVKLTLAQRLDYLSSTPALVILIVFAIAFIRRIQNRLETEQEIDK